MISSESRKKLLQYYVNVSCKERLDEVVDLIDSVQEWFQDNCLDLMYNELEKKLIERWMYSEDPFITPSLTSCVTIELEDKVKDEQRSINTYLLKLFIDKKDQEKYHTKFNRFFRSGLTGSYILVLSKSFPTVDDTNSMQRIKDNDPEIYEELVRKLDYIFNLAVNITKDIELVAEYVDRKDLTMDIIKKNSPKLINILKNN